LNASDRAPVTKTSSVGGWRVERWPRLNSTSDEARQRALAGDPGGLWILADEQTSGRGRQGRVWASPPGNLYASALIVDPCPVGIAAQVGFVAGVALRRAVADLGLVGVQLKWPNDLVHDGAKLAGLLVEGVTPPGRRLAVVVGFGVNVVSSPEGLAYPTTDLQRLAGAPIATLALFERLARRFDEALALWKRGSGFPAIREAWLASAAGLGGAIRASGARGAREGLFEGIDSSGRLLLRVGEAVETFESADLTLINHNSSGRSSAAGTRDESRTA
jgi:BirA family biotin operon repressor/biotin-[acetyl-CoA-carboxylase] ligase